MVYSEEYSKVNVLVLALNQNKIEETVISRSYSARWIPIVAASRTVKSNENKKELLNTWVNVVDFEQILW